ncbi:hypothetical protein NHX12_013780 [Muraenolepis orangiensis]|uniref:Uncharacterized protein n=1 Tax=Muraenolepis orangiensis TaxID=630683 RepID=A0A9Q0I4Z3_9TELE|nr:hypothetical protein NHX12_013780 [Muraenolepis orangiensis]
MRPGLRVRMEMRPGLRTGDEDETWSPDGDEDETWSPDGDGDETWSPGEDGNGGADEGGEEEREGPPGESGGGGGSYLAFALGPLPGLHPPLLGLLQSPEVWGGLHLHPRLLQVGGGVSHGVLNTLNVLNALNADTTVKNIKTPDFLLLSRTTGHCAMITL